MTQINGQEIANAFNQQNTIKTWKARASARTTGTTDLVFFENTGMVSFIHDAMTGQWQIKFNKFQGAWGDYVKAIARAFYVVSNVLKSAGLPYDAPTSLTGIYVTAKVGDDNAIYVDWLRPVQTNGMSATLLSADEAAALVPDGYQFGALDNALKLSE